MPMRLTRSWIEVDLDALVRNARTMQLRTPALLPMVKADAYGVGAVRVVRALEQIAPWGYGIATVEEGVELRNAGVGRPIVLFTSVHDDELSAVRAARLTPALASAAAISSWTRIGGGAWHLAIDTGMSRAGVRWDAVRELSSLLIAHPPEGAFTHFHSASLDDGSLTEQETRFEEAVGLLPATPPLLHAENSAALAQRERSRWSLGRPGIFLYGVGGGAHAIARPEPVLSVRARIVETRTLHVGETVSYDATFVAQRESRIATLPIGYADGYRRSLGNSAHALIAGRRVPVVGIVTMDMTMLDITDVDANVGDVVTLVGGDGTEQLGVATIAKLAGASPYEILTGFHARLPRYYIGGE